MNVPSDLKYTKSHEWVRLEDGVATIGITDYAQAELGDIVYVDLPSSGRSLAEEESFASVESVKTVSEVYAPVSGEVMEANPALGGQPELLNTDPYGQGWLIKMKLSTEPQGLLDAASYESSIS